MDKNKYWQSLDGIRGLAILMVITHNVQLLELDKPNAIGKAVEFAMNIGWIGVLMFFVLSGFLITGILLDTSSDPHRLRNFLGRRALRIFPLYYATLAIFFILLPSLNLMPGYIQKDTPHQIWLWAYLGNWTNYHWGIPHLWSLAAEEQFYLVWPFIVFWAKTPRSTAMIAALTATLSVGLRALMWHTNMSPDHIYQWTPTRMDALALGAMAASLWKMPEIQSRLAKHGGWLVPGGLLVLIAGAAATSGYSRMSANGQIWGYLALAIFFSIFILRSAWLDQNQTETSKKYWHKILSSSLLASVGKYSYAMYLFHKPLHDILSPYIVNALRLQPTNSVIDASAHILLMCLISYCLAWISWHSFETHFIKLKDRFF